MEDRRNASENSYKSGDGTELTGPILDVYDDVDDDDDDDDDDDGSKQIMYIMTGHYIQTYHTGAQPLVNESILISVWRV